MKGDLCFSDKSRISREILAYLLEHPDAEDTVDGIVQWWLLERKIKYQTNEVKQALARLIEQGLVVDHTMQNDVTTYRANHSRSEEIRRMVTGRGKETAEI